MTGRRLRAAAPLLLVVLAAGCGEKDEAPVAPARPTKPTRVRPGTRSPTPAPATPLPAPLAAILAPLGAVPAEAPVLPGAGTRLVELPGARAVEAWLALRAARAETKFHPLVVDPDCDLERMAETGMETTAAQELDAAAKVDLAAWMKTRAADYEPSSLVIGAWEQRPSTSTVETSGVHLLRDGKPVERIRILLVPCEHAWEVPARLGMGSWNEVPSAAELTAVFRSWEERFGAEAFSISHDVVEFAVTRPPTTKEATEQLAREQYLVCADIVDQGAETLGALCEEIHGSRYWFFWWD